MARYIDADLEVKKINNVLPRVSDKESVGYFAIEQFRHMLEIAPTADVVPKSEVERLQEALSKAEADVKNYMNIAEYQQNLSIKRYHEINRLKEDIERLEDINERDVENIHLAKTEVAREIFEEIEDVLNNLGYFDELDFNALKKKYTEE